MGQGGRASVCKASAPAGLSKNLKLSDILENMYRQSCEALKAAQYFTLFLHNKSLSSFLSCKDLPFLH